MCVRCSETKPFGMFYRDKCRSDGLHSYCKECVRSKVKTYKAENREKVSASNARYRESNRDKINTKQREVQPLRYGTRELDKPWPTVQCGYLTAHKRVKAVFGLAKTHECVDCAGAAKDWSYKGGSAVELSEWRLMPRGNKVLVTYSPDPVDYEPRCKPCHSRFDLLVRS